MLNPTVCLVSSRLVSIPVLGPKAVSLIPPDEARESLPVTVIHTLQQTLKAVGLGLRSAQTVGRPSETGGAVQPVMNDGIQRGQSPPSLLPLLPPLAGQVSICKTDQQRSDSHLFSLRPYELC